MLSRKTSDGRVVVHRVDARHVVRLLAAVRVAVGVVAFVAPRRSGRLVFGRRAEASRASTVALALVTRSFGARDIALGLGTLRALDTDRDPESWAKLSAACDAADVAAALGATRGVAPTRALAAAASAAVAASAGRWASSRLG